MAVRKEIVRNMKGMRKRGGHFIGYGKKGIVQSRNSWRRYWTGEIQNKAFKRVKANKGVQGVDGMTIEEAFTCLKEHKEELVERIRKGKYTPTPGRAAVIIAGKHLSGRVRQGV